MPNIAYDVDAGAIYLTISDHEIAETIELTEHIYFDLDEHGELVGIERVGLSPEGTSLP